MKYIRKNLCLSDFQNGQRKSIYFSLGRYVDFRKNYMIIFSQPKQKIYYPSYK